MARINSYKRSVDVEGQDAWVGTESEDRLTRNFTAENVAKYIAKYLNANGKISVSGQMTFKFTNAPTNEGEFTGPVDGAVLIDITTMEISAIDTSGQNTVAFMEYLVDNDMLISEQSDISNFSHFKVLSYALNGNVYTLNLASYGGNGNLSLDKYYDFAAFSMNSGGGTTNLATLSTVGIGNVNKGETPITRGTSVTYNAGTAIVGLDIDGLPQPALPADLGDVYIPYFNNAAPSNNQATLTDLLAGVSANTTLVSIACKNTSGSTIAKGTPVYQTGTVGATATIEVAPADALISLGQTPAIGLLQEELTNNSQGFVVITGELLSVTTNPIDGLVPVTGDKVFLKSGGGLTLTKPTTSLNGIQNLGLVGKVSGGNAGSITVSSIMRTNDVPNLPEGKIWVGDGNTIVSDTVYIDEPNLRLGIGTTSPDGKLHVTGEIGGIGNVLISDKDVGEAANVSLNLIKTGPKSIIFDAQVGATLALGSGANAEIMSLYDGKVGINTATPAAKLDVLDTQTDVTGTTYGAKFITNHEPTATANSTTYAIGGRYQYDGAFENAKGGGGVLGLGLASGDARPNILMGGDFIANYNGTSTAVLPGSLYAGRFNARISNGGYYNHIMGIKINSPILSGGATANSIWGMYIADVDVAGASIYAALNIAGTGENNAITFNEGVTKLWQEGSDLKTNENFVFENTKYLKFEDSNGNITGQFGMTGGDDMQLLTDESVVIKSNSVSNSHQLKLRNGNNDQLLNLRFSDGQATFLGDVIAAGYTVTGKTDADVVLAGGGTTPLAGLAGATQLSDLSDVNTTTPTNKNALMADGIDWESRPLVVNDISNMPLLAPSFVNGVTAIPLGNTFGTYVNQVTTDAIKRSSSYTLAGSVNGGVAQVLINTTTLTAFPTITGSTNIAGSDFEIDTDYYLEVNNNGNVTEHYFIRKDAGGGGVSANSYMERTQSRVYGLTGNNWVGFGTYGNNNANVTTSKGTGTAPVYSDSDVGILQLPTGATLQRIEIILSSVSNQLTGCDFSMSAIGNDITTLPTSLAENVIVAPTALGSTVLAGDVIWTTIDLADYSLTSPQTLTYAFKPQGTLTATRYYSVATQLYYTIP